MPRIVLRWGLVEHADLRRWVAQESKLPAPGIAAHTSTPAAIYYARAVHADEAAVRRVLAALPGTLDRVDALLAEGVLATDPPNAAGLQVLCSVRALDAFADLHDQVSRRTRARPRRARSSPAIPGLSRRSCRRSGSRPPALSPRTAGVRARARTRRGRAPARRGPR